MDVQRDGFKRGSADKIASSLKHSAEKSPRRKSGPFQSPISMLTFFINRAGRNLSDGRERVLYAANQKREKFGRPVKTH